MEKNNVKSLKTGLVFALVMALGACGGDNPAPARPSPPAAPAEPAPPATSAGVDEQGSDQQDSGQPAAMGTRRARAELAPTEGSDVRGSLTFTGENGAVRLTGTITGLEPGSQRGFHIHEFGDCSAPDAMSAGGHWNPEGHDHGRRSQGEFHAGDMNNVTADDTGSLTVDDRLAGLEVGTGSAMDIVGRAVIVHKGTDDYVSQPTGDAGPRAACGVIELQED
jgi:superoxide dismutase, Cu-Zn family